jgi:uncharacterized protein (TIGR02271 family)
MRARATTGEDLGRVVRLDDEIFVVERGGADPHAYELRYRYIADVRGDEIIYALTDTTARRDGRLDVGETSELRDTDTRSRTGSGILGAASGAAGTVSGAASSAASATSRTAGGVGERLSAVADKAREKLGIGGAATEPRGEALRADALKEGREEEMRLTLMDEEMAIEKVARETGHVRIRKEVRVEEKHVTVPVLVEEVIIERVPVGRDAERDTELAFRDQELDLALHDEEIRVVKRPVVREELRIRKLVHSENRDASASLRHEDVKVDDSAHPGPFPFRTGEASRTDRH